MTETTPRPPFVPPDGLVRLVRRRVLDAELAALVSLTVEGGIPLVVAGGSAGERLDVRDAAAGALAAGGPLVPLSGAGEDFAWMPEAGELGWRSGGHATPAGPGAVMVARLEDGAADAVWGEAAHLAIRALTVGYSLLATADGASLQQVLGRLAEAPVSAIDDELSRLGVVLVLGPGPRVEIAHYLRPAARDPGGHVQRLPPAALAAWNATARRYDHFAWGVVDELAGRAGRRPLAFEREQAERAVAISSAATGT